jgi:hypothetical protein
MGSVPVEVRTGYKSEVSPLHQLARFEKKKSSKRNIQAQYSPLVVHTRAVSWNISHVLNAGFVTLPYNIGEFLKIKLLL